MIIRALLVFSLAYLLTACEKQQVDTSIQLTFAVACSAVAPGMNAWGDYLKTHKVSVSDQQKVLAGYNAAVAACEGAPADSVDAITAAIKAAIAFKTTLSQVRNGA